MIDAMDEPTLEQVSSMNRAYFRAMGRRIADLRNRHEMTQAELARLLGVAQQTVYAIECAERRVRIDWLPVLTATRTAPCIALKLRVTLPAVTV